MPNVQWGRMMKANFGPLYYPALAAESSALTYDGGIGACGVGAGLTTGLTC